MEMTLDLETMLERLRALPSDRQAMAAQYFAELLQELAKPGPIFSVSEDERSILIEELAGAKRGEFATDDEVAEVLGKPWR